MSYDLMVFEVSKSPRSHSSFIQWYDKQAEWSEDHGYDDPSVSSPLLQSWFQEMIVSFPPMNGPMASDDLDNPNVTDYSIGRDVIYSAFSWSFADDAYSKMRELAQKHQVGFFDVSGDDAEVVFPDGTIIKTSPSKKPWWRFW